MTMMAAKAKPMEMTTTTTTTITTISVLRAFRRPIHISLSRRFRFCLVSFLVPFWARSDKSYRLIAGKASSRNKWPTSEEVKLLFRRLTALLRYPSPGKTFETSNVREGEEKDRSGVKPRA